MDVENKVGTSSSSSSGFPLIIACSLMTERPLRTGDFLSSSRSSAGLLLFVVADNDLVIAARITSKQKWKAAVKDMKLFSSVTLRQNSLECSSLASFTQADAILASRARAYPSVEHLAVSSKPFCHT
jgi:hypothetical protein